MHLQRQGGPVNGDTYSGNEGVSNEGGCGPWHSQVSFWLRGQLRDTQHLPRGQGTWIGQSVGGGDVAPQTGIVVLFRGQAAERIAAANGARLNDVGGMEIQLFK